MKFYVEITILPNAEVGHHFLWEKVFQQIHLGLVEMQDTNKVVPVGIALPEYDAERFSLGSKLRLFAETENILQRFDTNKWLSRLKDYVRISQIQKVPDKVSTFSCYKRQQTKTNKDRLARRKAKRLGISVEQAMKDMANFRDRLVKTPFINMQSQSSGKSFRLFIEKRAAHMAVNKGFNSYGLSIESALPDF